MEPPKTSLLLQFLLLVHLAGRYGLHAAETAQITLAADNPEKALCLPRSSLSQTWNVTGPKGSQVELNCAHLTLLEAANCTQGFLSILDTSGEEKICKDIRNYTRLSSANWMTVQVKTGASGTAQTNKRPRGLGRLACAVRLKKTDGDAKGEPSPSTDTGDYKDAKDNKKTSKRCQRANKKRIVGGEETERNEYPFMAYIDENDLVDIICGATILTKRHALSAYHCVKDVAVISDLNVVVGGHDTYEDCNNENVQFLTVSNAYPHHNYNMVTGENDLIVLFLSEDIVFNQFVQPVTLPSEHTNLIDQYVTAIGWGYLDCDGEGSITPQWTSLKVVNLERCQAAYPGNRFSLVAPIIDICTYEPDTDVCKGDSGGPLVYENPNMTPKHVQVGVIIGGECGLEKPSHSADVFTYISWIQAIIRLYTDEALIINRGGISL